MHNRQECKDWERCGHCKQRCKQTRPRRSLYSSVVYIPNDSLLQVWHALTNRICCSGRWRSRSAGGWILHTLGNNRDTGEGNDKRWHGYISGWILSQSSDVSEMKNAAKCDLGTEIERDIQSFSTAFALESCELLSTLCTEILIPSRIHSITGKAYR